MGSLMLQPAHHDQGPRYFPQQPSLGEPLSLGQRVVVRVLVSPERPCSAIYVRGLRDGEPFIEAAQQGESTDEGIWWQGSVLVANPVTSYRFFLDFADGTTAWLNATGVHERDVSDAHDFRITTAAPAPEWVRDAVVYQIFPDRFARGEQRPTPEWAIQLGWDDPVDIRLPQVAQQWFGGDLAGIRERLAHITDLGATVLYLTPIFPGASNHRYDAISFQRVDEVLGGDAALAELLEAAHARGLRVIGDLTTNHTGVDHEWFRRALSEPECAERQFYFFDDSQLGYAAWLGVPSLPKLDHTSPALRERLYEGAESVVAQWLSAGLDGWRIDVANMTGRHEAQDLTLDVARTVRATMTSTNPDTWLLAEHGHDFTQDLPGDGWHGSMNYVGSLRPLWTWLGEPDERITYLGINRPVPTWDGNATAATMREFAARAVWQTWQQSTTLLGSHDTARIRSVVGTAERHEVALAALMTLPGVPQVFMGDEWALTGITGEDSRTPMPWEGTARTALQGAETWQLYRRWIELRCEHEALRRGGLRWICATQESMTYLRETQDERLLVHLVRGGGEAVMVPTAGWLGAAVLAPLYGLAAQIVEGMVHLPAEGAGAHVYRLQ